MSKLHREALVIYGLPGSGKSTVLEIASDYGITSITMGDVVRKRAREAIDGEPNSQTIGEWATEQRKQHGPTIMAEHTCDELLSRNPSTTVIEGARSIEEINVFEQEFTIKTLRVDAPFDARLSRLQDRGRDGEKEFTATDLTTRDQREMDWGLGELNGQDTPDYVIMNDESLEEYRTEVTNVFDDLGW